MDTSNIIAKVIAIDTDDSQKLADRCIASGKKHGVTVEKYAGIPWYRAQSVLKQNNIRWTWANDNSLRYGITHCHYSTVNMDKRIGCFLSHYLLWEQCYRLQAPFLILEHDSVFLRSLPKELEWRGACQVNDPARATPRGQWWSDTMKRRGPGVWPKTEVIINKNPDGLAGNSAYLLKPEAADQLVEKAKTNGAWPNDALMCRQFFPWLEELYPFITEVDSVESTTSS